MCKAGFRCVLVMLLAPLFLGAARGQSTIEGGCPVVHRSDGAFRLTVSGGDTSCQNPAFSPDGKRILFTRFLNGYNRGPSELVVMPLSFQADTVVPGGRQVVIGADDADNVNVPGPSWIGDEICWSSDREGGADEIFVARSDGGGIERITTHPESLGYYIEPVFDPADPDRMLFEYGPDDTTPHRLGLIERDRNNRVTLLTDGTFDARLPSWSWDGATILFQQADPYSDNWRIMTAELDDSGGTPRLVKVRRIPQPEAHNTDNSWYANNRFILSSTDPGIPLPNIFAIDVANGKAVPVTVSGEHEDGAPSTSPDGAWIAFESHRTRDEDSPSDIWIIRAPPLVQTAVSKQVIPSGGLILFPNEPNPFLGSTTIRFSNKREGRALLQVFDATGRRVATLMDEYVRPGEHSVVFQPGHLPAGSYFYRLTIGSRTLARCMIYRK